MTSVVVPDATVVTVPVIYTAPTSGPSIIVVTQTALDVPPTTLGIQDAVPQKNRTPAALSSLEVAMIGLGAGLILGLLALGVFLVLRGKRGAKGAASSIDRRALLGYAKDQVREIDTTSSSHNRTEHWVALTRSVSLAESAWSPPPSHHSTIEAKTTESLGRVPSIGAASSRSAYSQASAARLSMPDPSSGAFRDHVGNRQEGGRPGHVPLYDITE